MKKYLVALLLCSAVASHSQIDLDAGLVGYFKFNGDAIDQSTLSIDGTPVSVTDSEGLECTDQAYSYNGTNSGILLSGSSRGITDQVSISTWVKFTSAGIFDIANKYSFTEDKGFHFSCNGGNVAIGGRDNSGTYRFSGWSSTAVNDGDWHHVMGVVNVTSWEIWVDGTMENSGSSGAASPSIATSSAVEFAIGQDNWEGEEYFEGIIEEFRIYNRDLTTDEKNFLSDTLNLNNGVNDSIVETTDSLTVYESGLTYQWISCVSGLELTGETDQTIVPLESGYYACIVSNGECTDTTDCVNFEIDTQGLLRDKLTDVSVYPNPSNGFYQVQGFTERFKYSVLDLTGKKVQFELKDGVLDISNLQNGVYFLKVRDEKEAEKVVRLVKR